jgi:hypothetical protein
MLKMTIYGILEIYKPISPELAHKNKKCKLTVKNIQRTSQRAT